MVIVSLSGLQGLVINEARQISDDVQMLHQIHAGFGQVSAEAESLIITGDLIKLFEMSEDL